MATTPNPGGFEIDPRIGVDTARALGPSKEDSSYPKIPPSQ